jgi:hypothetical protein
VTIEVARPNETASTVEQRFFAPTTTSAAPSARCSPSAAQAGLRFVNSKLGWRAWHAAWSATASRPRRCTATRARTSA